MSLVNPPVHWSDFMTSLTRLITVKLVIDLYYNRINWRDLGERML